ncbi:hypothetical protein F5Y04DRAFT_288996 [Hypomontagnella monticulosa]|nr:hypothetical protein F5Y04DRAFT_288996 [Hypomontagnella monticulosa]
MSAANPQAGTMAAPPPLTSVVILIGENEVPFQVPFICFGHLSQQYAYYVLNMLPRRNGCIVYRDMNQSIFHILGQFQYHRGYDVPLVWDQSVSPYQEERRVAPADSIINWVKHKWEIFALSYDARDYYSWFMEYLGLTTTQNPDPPTVDISCLITHAQLYILATTHNIPDLARLALIKLLTVIFLAHATTRFADDFLDMLLYVYANTGRCDALRVSLWQILLLIADGEFWPELYANPKLRQAASMYEEIAFELGHAVVTN